ncbi:MAG TPA: YdcF family protein [Bryobacteraceae bacterium]|nr:YdcF family protein [Bryobacteraceae bacterium]
MMRKTAGRLWRWIRMGCAALGAAVLIVTLTPVTSWASARLAGPWNDPQGAILVVLSGSGSDQGMLGESSYWRAFYAALAWREGHWKKIVLLGGGDPPASSAMKTFLEAAGVPGSAIVTETESSSTRESAIRARPLLDSLPGIKVLMTSDYHMYRAAGVFRKAGIEFAPRPIPDALKRAVSWNLRWSVFQDLVIESIKITYYRLHGWI